MNKQDQDLRAAEYVLGTLEAEDRLRFQEDLAEDPDLQDLVAGWEGRLAGLDGESEPEALPEGLWARISDDLTAEGAANVTLRADEGEWRVVGQGVEKKILHTDPATGRQSFLMRMAPGSTLRSHPHKLTEECLMIEGELSVGGLRLRAGDYHSIQAGQDHPEIFSQQGALFFIRGEIRAA